MFPALFLGARCVACGRPGDRLCASCVDGMQPAQPFAPPPGLDACMALLAYGGAARDLVLALKYRNARALARRGGDALAAGVRAHEAEWWRSAGGALDVVTWAPTGRGRRRARGYDQAELLARAVGRRLRVPVRRLLERDRGAPQTGLSRDLRLAGPAFTSTPAADRQVGATILIVDDVLTTGATLRAAADALGRVQPAWLGAAVLAHTELRAPAAPPANVTDPTCSGTERASR